MSTGEFRKLVEMMAALRGKNGCPWDKEQGFATIEGSGWIGVYAPAKTPQALLEALSSAIGAAVRTPEIAERLVRLGYEPTGTSPSELAAIMAADTARWAPIIKASGFTPE